MMNDPMAIAMKTSTRGLPAVEQVAQRRKEQLWRVWRASSEIYSKSKRIASNRSEGNPANLYRIQHVLIPARPRAGSQAAIPQTLQRAITPGSCRQRSTGTNR